MLNNYNFLNFGINNESELNSIPEIDSDSSFEEIQHYPTQLIYSPIIKSIKTKAINKNITRFIFRDKGKKVKKLYI